MFHFFDEDLDNMELVEGALALNAAINPSTSVKWAELKLDKLVEEAELALISEREPKQRFDALLRLFYNEWEFKGDEEQYFSSSNVFVDKVIERRTGSPVSLGAILLFLAHKLDLPVSGVSFPTQFILRVDWPGEEALYLNPFNGEFVGKSTLQAWLIGQDGPLATLKPEHLAVSDNPTIIGRWLAVIKSALLREEHYSLALRCTDLALTFSPDDPYEIRDRGFIYQQLECHQIAASDYEFFIENCPEDPAAELLKAQVKALNERPTTLH
ncbi:SirB1 family protein [Vibrio sp. Of7-15]|uniref:SirB1 family protein n=1 Tax=Vibrio sp. Of7-15 TaxID=2724879 RepID=UPI001EF3152E|nr:SirB1 family protein [Vibrio sp. Of7-15]MCG7495734.1 SirB1 family protein [Vibrio sp. Of7-15]